jgi:hypothetical protein
MYWITGGVAYVTYTVQYQNGYTGTQQVSFLQATPDVTQINASFLDGSNPLNTVQFQNVPGLNGVLSLGVQMAEDSLNTSGISASAQVTVPAGGDGELAFVQLANALNTATLSDGTTGVIISTGGAYQSDGSQPYGGGMFSVSGSNGLAGFGDLPQQRGIIDTELRVQVVQDFKLFLMYRPAGGIWVTLKEIDWGWSAAVSRASGTSWTANAFESTPALRGPTITDSSSLPIWTGLAQGISH